MIRASFNYQVDKVVVVPPVDPDIQVYNSFQNTRFDHRYLASDALKKGLLTIPAHGDEIERFKDQKGNRDIDYEGVRSYPPGERHPNLTGKWPTLIKQAGYWANRDLYMTLFENETAIQYGNEPRTGMSDEQTTMYIFYNPVFKITEAWNNTTNDYYWGESNRKDSSIVHTKTLIRFTSSATNGYSNQFEVDLLDNAVNVIVFKTLNDGHNGASDKISVQCWCNAVKGIPFDGSGHAETYRRPNIKEHIGTDSNCALHGFIEFARVYRAMSDAEIVDVSIAAMDFYKVGQATNIPKGGDLIISKSDDQITLGYTYLPGADGLGENTDLREVRWGNAPNGAGVQDVHFIPALDGKMTFNRSDYPGLFIDGSPLSVRLVVADTAGKKSHVPAALFKGV